MLTKVQWHHSAELKSSAAKMLLEDLRCLSQDLHIPMKTLHSWVTKGLKGELWIN